MRLPADCLMIGRGRSLLCSLQGAWSALWDLPMQGWPTGSMRLGALHTHQFIILRSRIASPGAGLRVSADGHGPKCVDHPDSKAGEFSMVVNGLSVGPTGAPRALAWSGFQSNSVACSLSLPAAAKTI
jgi:hypothetical protein